MSPVETWPEVHAVNRRTPNSKTPANGHVLPAGTWPEDPQIASTAPLLAILGTAECADLQGFFVAGFRGQPRGYFWPSFSTTRRASAARTAWPMAHEEVTLMRTAHPSRTTPLGWLRSHPHTVAWLALMITLAVVVGVLR
jgi:hypothetical protein